MRLTAQFGDVWKVDTRHMDDQSMQYLQDNRRVAERLLIFLGDRGLLRNRVSLEDYEECRLSALELRKVLEAEMLTIQGKGFLLSAMRDMQSICTTFNSAAGRSSRNFQRDGQLFEQHLSALRTVFAQRLRLIVRKFDLDPVPDEIQRIIDFDS